MHASKMDRSSGKVEGGELGFTKNPSIALIQGLSPADKALRQLFPTPTDSGYRSGTLCLPH